MKTHARNSISLRWHVARILLGWAGVIELFAMGCNFSHTSLATPKPTLIPPSATAAQTIQPTGTPDTRLQFGLEVGSTPPPDFTATGELHWPLDQAGVLKQIYSELHPGIDVAAPKGTPVLAADNGIVAWAEYTETYGNLVIIDHANGFETRYGHLDVFQVKASDRVRQGAPIGLVGSTGASAGDHLHFEVRLDGRPVSPIYQVVDVPASVLETYAAYKQDATASAQLVQP